jgi:pimeloyl-ACP methyl ester carboxylesterase
MRLLLWQLSLALPKPSMTMEPTLKYLQCPDTTGSHRMAYWDWGSPAHPHVVVCVHGVSRQGRDFDTLARALIGPDGQRCRVVSVDVAGRGYSDWLKDPAMYQLPIYAADLMALLAMLRAGGTVQTIDWVGTSLGGLIGIAVAAQPTTRLRKLVLNDVGPVVQWDAIQRISSYIGNDPRFATEQEAVDYLWQLSLSFGPHTPEQWLALSRPMLRKDGAQIKLHYDPAIAVAFKATTPELAAQGEAMLWQLYDTLRCDTLLLRGAESDLISPATAQAMQERGPKAKLVEFAGVGHAPTLVADYQVAAVANFLFAS